MICSVGSASIIRIRVFLFRPSKRLRLRRIPQAEKAAIKLAFARSSDILRGKTYVLSVATSRFNAHQAGLILPKYTNICNTIKIKFKKCLQFISKKSIVFLLFPNLFALVFTFSMSFSRVAVAVTSFDFKRNRKKLKKNN